MWADLEGQSIACGLKGDHVHAADFELLAEDAVGGGRVPAAVATALGGLRGGAAVARLAATLGGGLGIKVRRERAGTLDRELRGRADGPARAGLARSRLTEARADPRAGPVARRPRRPDALRGGHGEQVSDEITYVAVDGGMSDNPRPQLYDAAYSGLLANRADEPPSKTFVVCGKHCESGDVMIHGLPLPEPGAATCSPFRYRCLHAGDGVELRLVPRPAAVLVGGR